MKLTNERVSAAVADEELVGISEESSPEGGGRERNRRANPGIVRARAKIRHEYFRPLTVGLIARECGMSERSLQRHYRVATGTTVVQALIARRIEVAAGLLVQQDAKLDAVALACGLGTSKNLCRVFKEQTGTTPGQWKRSRTSDHSISIHSDPLHSNETLS